jgi:hypothetical protein
MRKGHSGGQELGELVSTARNMCVNAGSVAKFDFHQSDKSTTSSPTKVSLCRFFGQMTLTRSVTSYCDLLPLKNQCGPNY